MLIGEDDDLRNLTCPQHGSGFYVNKSIRIQPLDDTIQPRFKCGSQGRAFDIQGAGSLGISVTFHNISIENGTAGKGGCIRAERSSVKLYRVDMHHCTATLPVIGDGGAIFVSLPNMLSAPEKQISFELDIYRCQLTNCYAQGEGGCISVNSQGTNLTSARIHIALSQFINATHLGVGGDPSGGVQTGGVLALRTSAKYNGSYFTPPTTNHSLVLSNLTVVESEFKNCNSERNGASIGIFAENFDSNRIFIRRNSFINNTARVLGGAIWYLTHNIDSGTVCDISFNLFRDCKAKISGGGAIALTNYHHGIKQGEQRLEGNNFLRCSTSGNGGAIMLLSSLGNYNRMLIGIMANDFKFCSATISGGALDLAAVEGELNEILLDLRNCMFVNSESESGGSVEIATRDIESSKFDLLNSVFQQSRAAGSGGAVHLTTATFRNSTLSLQSSQFYNCSAKTGAVLYVASLPGELRPLTQHQDPFPNCTCHWNLPDRLVDGLVFLAFRNIIAEDITVNDPGLGGLLFCENCEIVVDGLSAKRLTASSAGSVVFARGRGNLDIKRANVSNSRPSPVSLIDYDGSGIVRIKNSKGVTYQPNDDEFQRQQLIRVYAQSLHIEDSNLYCGRHRKITLDENINFLYQTIWPAQTAVTGACVPCPSHRLITFPQQIFGARCEPCRANEYLLSQGELNDKNLIHDSCHECPFGAECDGSTEPQAFPGFWGAERDGQVFSLTRCPDGYCCAPSQQSEMRTCSSFNTCAPLREGIGCGRCVPTATEQLGSGDCRRNEDCGNTTDALIWVGALIIVVAAAAIVVMISPDRPEMERKSWSTASVSASARVAHAREGVKKALVVHLQTLALVIVVRPSQSAGESTAQSLARLANLAVPIPTSWCPLPGMTPSGRQFFEAFRAFLLIGSVLGIKSIHKLLASLTQKCRNACPISYTIAASHRYTVATTKMTTLVFATVAQASINLILCNEVSGVGVQQTIDMNEKCGRVWWFWVGLIWFAANVVWSPFAMGYGLRHLQANKTKPQTFCWATVFSGPILLHWIWKNRSSKENYKERSPQDTEDSSNSDADVTRLQQKTNAIVCEDFSMGFKEKYHLWQSVLHLRKLLFVLTSFVTSLFVRSILQVALCLVLLAIQQWHQPFATTTGNRFESILLILLCFAASANASRARIVASALSDPEGMHTTVVDVSTLLAAVGPFVIGLLLFIFLCWRVKYGTNLYGNDTWSPEKKRNKGGNFVVNPILADERTEGAE